jgi:hypothetical protein
MKCSYNDILYTIKENKYNKSIDQIINNKIKKKFSEQKYKFGVKKINSISKVIYVLSDPQPGQVRGDWSVRRNGKIYSNHRSKINAIKKARKIAIKFNEKVIVQNMDGSFNPIFKPRLNKH